LKYWAFLILLIAAGPCAADEPVILVVGDSLSAAYGIERERGWVRLLAERLERSGSDWRVVNASISGDTTAGGLSRLPALLQRHRPELVLIELGSNDGLRGFGFERIRENLGRMIELSRQAGARPLLIGGRVPPNYGSTYAEAFHELFRTVATEQGVPLVPFLLEGVAQDFALMQADGYHPTAEAQPRLLGNVWPVLRPVLDQSDPAANRRSNPKNSGS